MNLIKERYYFVNVNEERISKFVYTIRDKDLGVGFFLRLTPCKSLFFCQQYPYNFHTIFLQLSNIEPATKYL